MEQKSEENHLVEVINQSVSKIRNKHKEFTPKCKSYIGFCLGYFLTDVLKSEKDSNIRGKWIDAVEFRELKLISEGKSIFGWGLLWWGIKKDPSTETFPDTLYCQITPNFENNEIDSYYFSFWIDQKTYELRKNFQSEI